MDCQARRRKREAKGGIPSQPFLARCLVEFSLTFSAFLGDLDNDPRVGDKIDCTSSFEIEQEEMMRKSGQDLTPDMWLVRLPRFPKRQNADI